MDSEFGAEYERVMNSLFDYYVENTDLMLEFMKKKYPKPDSMADGFYNSITKARACDVLRYTLPSATLTNIGMTSNARSLEHLIVKMLSHPIEEMNEIAETMKSECSKILPSLLKAAKKDDYLSASEHRMHSFAKKFALKSEKVREVELMLSDPDIEAKLVASIVYRYSQHSFEQCLEQAKKMSEAEKEKVVDEFVAGLENGQPLREFEHCYFTFDILIDYGAFRDIQRHRMCTQTNQLLSTDHGFSLPEALAEAGIDKGFIERMNEARKLFDSMREELPFDAQYCVPLAFKKRVLFTWNLRELWHFIKLRSGPTGHKAYRKTAQLCFEEIKSRHPLLAKYLKVNLN